MSKLNIESLEQDAKLLVPHDEVLAELARLASYQINIEDEIYLLEEKLKEMNKELRTISCTSIPELMAQVGIKDYTLCNGSKITVKPFYEAKIPTEREDEAFKWLEDNDYDAIIKHFIEITLSKGENEAAKVITGFLKENEIFFKDVTKIHPQTLKAFIKDLIEGNNEDSPPLPYDLFGVYVGQITKIKRGDR